MFVHKSLYRILNRLVSSRLFFDVYRNISKNSNKKCDVRENWCVCEWPDRGPIKNLLEKREKKYEFSK